ncbi:MAG: NAD(P)-dependent dehydrogenase (short-subunit alcohol dehydrogenase family) [Hyphomicrobiaceae bacterium]|jgi:NAD(P)-dependent dehydrogenase (short-subunit alcohol dehydrogenase family)
MSEPKPRQTVLITGAAKRIGRALALDFANRGWDVAIHFNSSSDDAEALATEIRSIGRRAIAQSCNLANTEAVQNLIPDCASELGPVTCLINNASEFRFDSIDDLTSESWNLHLDINLKAPVFLAKSMAQNLPAGAQGHVINIIDQRVWNLTPEFFSYTVSKAGLWSATRMLAQALAPRVRVNAIGPGPVLKSIHQTEEEFEREVQSTLLERGTTPDEIAHAIRFILDAPAMTGQMLALDGGQHLSWSAASQPASVSTAPLPTITNRKPG